MTGRCGDLDQAAGDPDRFAADFSKLSNINLARAVTNHLAKLRFSQL